MLVFPIQDLLDEQKCYDKLVGLLHPGGLRCPQCGSSVAESAVHSRERQPLLKYRCRCGRFYNAFAGTLFQGTHRLCSQLVAFLQGVVQGKTTAHLAQELGAGRRSLLDLRHRLQQNALAAAPHDALPDSVAEFDEMYQNAGEKRASPSRPRRSTAAARQ